MCNDTFLQNKGNISEEKKHLTPGLISIDEDLVGPCELPIFGKEAA
jgi:hypothetical protein